MPPQRVVVEQVEHRGDDALAGFASQSIPMADALQRGQFCGRQRHHREPTLTTHAARHTQGRGKQRREALRKTVHGRVRKWQLRPRKGIDPRGCKGAPVLHGELDETLRVVEGTVQHHAGPIAPGVDALHGRVHALRANSGVAH